MKFTYSAKNAKGEIQNGGLEAPDEKAAAKTLHSQGLFVLNIAAEASLLPGSKGMNIDIPFFSKRVNLKDRIIFTQQLAMMINAGLPLVDAFNALEEQTENKYFAGAIHAIKEEVKGGKSLSSSLSKYPNIFSTFYVAIVMSGEKSGQLDKVLERLAQELEKDYELITKIKAAVTYPILIICALVGIVILMLIFVIPQMKKIFADMGVELPLITRIVLGTSDAVRNYWYIFLIVIVGLFLGARFWARTESGGFILDNMKMRLPLVGKLIRKVYLSRFCRTTGTLVASGLPILDIMKTTCLIMNNRVYRNALQRVGQEIENGRTFSDSLKKQAVFPAMIYHLVFVGEKSGKLDEILLSMANFFDRDIETMTANLASLVEPILIMVVGAGVGLVVAAVIMPIYSLVNVI